MKKKFLSLMMAAAVVATTSVSAFAQDKLIDNVDTSSPTTDVQITGSVTSQTGEMPESTFKVTVPTTATFSVDKSGGFTAPTLTVKNEGAQKVDVYAYSFKDNSGAGKINILSPSAFQTESNAKRSDVKISLRGQFGDIVHLSSTNEHGVNTSESFSETRGDDGFRLLQLEASTDGTAKTGTISLDGTAGTGATEGAISDTFVLTLKIKKGR